MRIFYVRSHVAAQPVEDPARSQLSHLGTFFFVRGATPGTPVHLVLEFRGEKIRQVTQASIYVHSSATMG